MPSKEELLQAVDVLQAKLDACKEFINNNDSGFFESRRILKNLKKAGGYL
jgi:hypothetical protein